VSETRAIRVVLDQGVPRDAAALLRERGVECLHAGEIGMSRASDKEILAWSLERRATVVTLDADFHTILAVSGADGPSVIRLRMQGLNGLAVAELVGKVLADFESELARGSMVTIKANKTACHRLPIGRL
jgi:predicted nuclease of predicted toxin-antitoxin system